jgi:diguanylate cyclase (GGDEF)-like protein
MNLFSMIDSKSLIAFTIPLFAINSGLLNLAFGVRQRLFLRWLTWGCLMFSLGWLLFLLRFSIGINLVTLPLANVFILGMPISLSLATANLFNIRLPKFSFPAIFFLLSITFSILALCMNHPWIPAVYSSLLNSLFYLLSGIIILRFVGFKNSIVNLIFGLNLATFLLLLARAFFLGAGWLHLIVVNEATRDNWLTLALLLNIVCINAQVLCFPILEFMEAQKELTEANVKLDQISKIDVLTGVMNRRSLKEIISLEMARYVRDGTPFSVILCDLDFFKKINDNHGHLAGDYVLTRVAQLLQKVVRSQDIVIRYGGEEFIILLTATGRSEAFNIAERLRSEVELMSFSHPDLPDPFRVTASFGVADLNDQIFSLQDLLKVADQALYQAKDEGRNRVCIVA